MAASYLELRAAWLRMCNRSNLTPLEKCFRELLRQAKTEAWIKQGVKQWKRF